MVIKFIPATNFHASRNRKVRLVVVHDMEYPETPLAAEWCAGYFSGDKAPKASAHYYVDNDSVIQGVKESHTAWAAPGANADGIQIEHAGHARQTRAQWLDTYSTQMLRVMSAPLVAQICARHGIPIVHLTDTQLRRGHAGIIGHAQASRVYRLSDHTDPGVNFPWDKYIEWVIAASKQRSPSTPAALGPPTEPRGPFPLAKGHWYGPDDRTLYSHSGKRKADRFAITLIQRKVKVGPDGLYGPRTTSAVRVWQAAHGLRADGLVGAITWARM